MKKVLLTALITLFIASVGFSNNEPKLLKEIKRKITLDISKVNLKKSKKEFVIVKFSVTDGKINIIDISGSLEELTQLMMKELEEMMIRTEIKDAATYQFKFNFEKE